MTEISKSSEQSLNNILNKLGVKTQDQAQKPTNKNNLGQEDFLKLMTTQLQNQDPFAPMENGEYIAIRSALRPSFTTMRRGPPRQANQY